MREVGRRYHRRHIQRTAGNKRLYQPLLRNHASRGLMLAGAEPPPRPLSSVVAVRALVCRIRNSLFLGAGRWTNFGFESTLAPASSYFASRSRKLVLRAAR